MIAIRRQLVCTNSNRLCGLVDISSSESFGRSVTCPLAVQPGHHINNSSRLTMLRQRRGRRNNLNMGSKEVNVPSLATWSQASRYPWLELLTTDSSILCPLQRDWYSYLAASPCGFDRFACEKRAGAEVRMGTCYRATDLVVGGARLRILPERHASSWTLLDDGIH